MLGKLTVLSFLVVASLSFAEGSEFQELKMEITKRTPVELKDMQQLRTYAGDNQYYFSVKLRAGMRVLYSASYGNGEAGQARGVLVEQNGRFYFKQQENTTTQLLLPPGLPFNSPNKVSLWDVGAYMDLVNRVVFSEPNAASYTATNVYGNKPEAYVVDFKGGTAGASITYSDALEVNFQRKVSGQSNAKCKMMYAKSIGPVALEFTETMAPSGTFKLYVGE